jgi:hypothetical protein
MGISMRLYLAPDSDLRAFTGAPKTLQKWLRQRRSLKDMWLQEHWRDIDAILAADPSASSNYSPLTPRGADFVYPTVADHGAHGLTSTSTEQLLQSLAQVTTPRVEAYVRLRSMIHSSEPGSAPLPTTEQLAAETQALLTHLACLEEACMLAVSKRYGLVMALWNL